MTAVSCTALTTVIYCYVSIKPVETPEKIVEVPKSVVKSTYESYTSLSETDLIKWVSVNFKLQNFTKVDKTLCLQINDCDAGGFLYVISKKRIKLEIKSLISDSGSLTVMVEP